MRSSLAPHGGSPTSLILTVPPLGRATLNAHDALPSTDFVTIISADAPIMAERAYYSLGDGLYGALGYTPRGPRAAARTWYFADGNTTGQVGTLSFGSYLADQPASVWATYFGDDARRREPSVAVPPYGRVSVRGSVQRRRRHRRGARGCGPGARQTQRA